ncbi:MAG: multicopper oxidase domain-containing protein, partial [Nitrospirota bacterium]
MKNQRLRLLVGTAILFALPVPGMGTPCYANENTSETQLDNGKGNFSPALARSPYDLDQDLKKLKKVNLFKKFEKFKKFKKFGQLKIFPQPRTRRSHNGFLYTTLAVDLSRNFIRDPSSGVKTRIRSPTYEGNLIGPTLRVKPGDTMVITMPNNLPPNPIQERKGPFPHDPHTTNLHTHGLTVSPNGIADNVFRKMEPGSVSQVRIDIPSDHPSGTFWYHPHKHGSVSFQFFGGMGGFLIIEGGPGTLDQVPAVKAAKEVLMGFQVIRTDQNGDLPFVNEDSSQFSSVPGTTTGL